MISDEDTVDDQGNIIEVIDDARHRYDEDHERNYSIISYKVDYTIIYMRYLNTYIFQNQQPDYKIT